MIRALIVDDEQRARQTLENLLLRTGAFEIIGSCANAFEAIKEINRARPEVLFLDIQMPVLSGFELLAMIDETIMPHVVFVTAYDEFALKAFEEKTLDYLLKPIEPARLEKTVEKLTSAIGSGTQPRYDTAPIRHVPCVSTNKIRLIDPDQIEYVHSDLTGVHVIAAQGVFFTELTLKVLENRTDLLRCHKQYLVNIDRVEEIVLLDAGLAEIRMHSGRQLPVSRRYLKALKDRFGI